MIRPALSIFVDANPDWYGRLAPKALKPMGRRLLSAHITIASSWKVLWWIRP